MLVCDFDDMLLADSTIGEVEAALKLVLLSDSTADIDIMSLEETESEVEGSGRGSSVEVGSCGISETSPIDAMIGSGSRANR